MEIVTNTKPDFGDICEFILKIDCSNVKPAEKAMQRRGHSVHTSSVMKELHTSVTFAAKNIATKVIWRGTHVHDSKKTKT